MAGIEGRQVQVQSEIGRGENFFDIQVGAGGQAQGRSVEVIDLRLIFGITDPQLSFDQIGVDLQLLLFSVEIKSGAQGQVSPTAGHGGAAESGCDLQGFKGVLTGLKIIKRGAA